MTRFGYALSCEQDTPNDLVDQAVRTEEVGFDFAVISDHYHPWLRKQGHSPLVWTVIGGIARETDDLELGTGVTCPIIRVHPAIVAQAAATSAAMMPDRFFLGVGTGESLNEHIVGERWPEHEVRLEMLEEAVGIIRELWTGEETSHHGEHYTVENAQLFTVPEEPPPLHVAAEGSRSAAAAADLGDGLISTAPESSLVEGFRDAGGDGPRYGQTSICYAEDEDEALRIAHEHWPTGVLPGELGQELPTPTHFEQAAGMVTEEDIAESMVLGSDADEHIERLEQYVDAGFDDVYVHQVHPEPNGVFEFYEEEVLPSFR